MTQKMTDSLERALISQELQRAQDLPLFTFSGAIKAVCGLLSSVMEGIRAARPVAAKGEW